VDDLFCRQYLNCYFQDLLEHLCISLCYAMTSSHRQIIHIPSNCHKKGDCCQFIYSQAIELAIPLNLYTLVHECTNIALCLLMHTSMWTQTHILSAHHLICLLMLLHVFSFLFLPVISMDSFLPSLLIPESSSWQKNIKDNIWRKNLRKILLSRQQCTFLMHAVLFTHECGTSSGLARDAMLTEPMENMSDSQ